MKNLKTFTEFINESVDSVNESISKDLILVLEEMELTLEYTIKETDKNEFPELIKAYNGIAKQLKTKANKVYVIDEYSADEDDNIQEAYAKLESKFRGNDLWISDDYNVSYDARMNACRLVDNIDGMTAYYVIDKSKI